MNRRFWRAIPPMRTVCATPGLYVTDRACQIVLKPAPMEPDSTSSFIQ